MGALAVAMAYAVVIATDSLKRISKLAIGSEFLKQRFVTYLVTQAYSPCATKRSTVYFKPEIYSALRVPNKDVKRSVA